MSDSVRPQSWQPTRLQRPWGSPSKSTVVDCPFLLQCRKVKRESEIAQLCPTLCDPMDFSLPGSSVHGILQARNHWSGLPFPSPGCCEQMYALMQCPAAPGDLPKPGIKSRSPALQADALPKAPGLLKITCSTKKSFSELKAKE